MFSRLRTLFILAITIASSSLFSNCANDDQNKLVVNVKEQRMRLYNQGHLVSSYRVSTSKFGLGNRPGSNCTPVGKMQIVRKIGGNAPLGAVFKGRRPTGEILRPNQPGRDPVVTRIMQLRGLESANANTLNRMIYIHGTPEEHKLGRPASYGCIRMSSRDVADLYNKVGVGALVYIKRNGASSTESSSSNTINMAYNR